MHVELFKKLAFIAHRRPEIKRTRTNLQDTNAPKRFDDVAHRDKVSKPAFKDGVIEAAIRHVSKRHAEPPKNFARREESALCVAKSYAVFVGAFVERSPKQNWQVHIAGKAGANVFRPEVAMREKQPVDFLRLELFENLEAVVLVVKQALFVNVVNVHEVNPQLVEAVFGQPTILDCVGCTEDTPARRRVTQFDFRHVIKPP